MKQHNKSKQHRLPGLFWIITIIQIVFLICIFLFKKTGYHEDEFFTYGLSNSFMHPFLYGSDLQVCDNYDVWLIGDDFKNYLRTNDQTKFRYDSVWYNQKMDTNPPLHYAVIHTISSVLNGHFSWWYAFAVNLISFVVFQICFYLLNMQIIHSEKIALLVCAFWGFTLAGQGLFLFLRMYAMLAAFTMLYVYLSFRVIDEKQIGLKNSAWIFLVALGGALTQHLFLPFAFFITALECFYFLFMKQWKKLFGYGLSASAGTGLSFAVFPATFDHLFHSRFHYTQEPDIRRQIIVMASDSLRSMTGIELPLNSDILLYIRVTVLFIIPIFLPLLFLFRKQAAVLYRKLREKLKQWKKNMLTDRPKAIILLLSSTVFLVLVSSRFYYLDFGADSIRYVFQILPFFLLLGVCALRILYRACCSRISVLKCRIGVLLLACAALVFQNVKFDPQYVISADPDNGHISEYTAGQNCILLPLNAIFMPIYCGMMEDAADIYDTVLINDHYRISEQENEYRKIFRKGEPFFLVFDSTTLLPDDYYDTFDPDDLFSSVAQKQYGDHWTEKEIVNYFQTLSGYTAEYCTAETTHFNRIIAYRFIPPTENTEGENHAD